MFVLIINPFGIKINNKLLKVRKFKELESVFLKAFEAATALSHISFLLLNLIVHFIKIKNNQTQIVQRSDFFNFRVIEVNAPPIAVKDLCFKYVLQGIKWF